MTDDTSLTAFRRPRPDEFYTESFSCIFKKGDAISKPPKISKAIGLFPTDFFIKA
jgi:hypothetical protein